MMSRRCTEGTVGQYIVVRCLRYSNSSALFSLAGVDASLFDAYLGACVTLVGASVVVPDDEEGEVVRVAGRTRLRTVRPSSCYHDAGSPADRPCQWMYGCFFLPSANKDGWRMDKTHIPDLDTLPWIEKSLSVLGL